ncbi:MAG: GNAT family N-acetyltransferase [Rhizobiaceae bacterium]
MNSNVKTSAFADTYSLGLEMPHEAAQREALLDRAMGPGRKRKSSEKLRRGRLAAEGLSFVARNDDGAVIGTVRLWNVAATCVRRGQAEALLLGPLAVDPFYNGKGIGSALMHSAIGEAKRLEHGAIILVGDAEYYKRFGFTAEKTGDLFMPGPFEKSRLLALELQDGAVDGMRGVLFATGRKVIQRPVKVQRAA